jgi:hypothetical protein
MLIRLGMISRITVLNPLKTAIFHILMGEILFIWVLSLFNYLHHGTSQLAHITNRSKQRDDSSVLLTNKRKAMERLYRNPHTLHCHKGEADLAHKSKFITLLLRPG